MPADGRGAGGQLHDGLAASEPRTLQAKHRYMSRSRRPFAVGKFAVTFDGVGCVRRCRRLQAYRPGDQGWGRGNRPVINVLGRCQGLCDLAIPKDRQDLSPADRGGAGVCGARRHDDTVPVGLFHYAAAGELRWLRRALQWRWFQWASTASDRAGRQLRGEPLGPLRHARQCMGMGSGLLARQ